MPRLDTPVDLVAREAGGEEARPVDDPVFLPGERREDGIDGGCGRLFAYMRVK